MPPTHTDEGLRAAIRIRAEHPQVAVMVLSAYVAEAYVPELLDSAPGGGRRLPAQGPGRPRPRVPRQPGPGRRRRDGHRPAGRPPAARPAPRRRPARRADRARAGGAGADGRGPHQRRDRRARWSSARRRCASTSATSSPSFRSTRPRTAGSPLCSPICAAEVRKLGGWSIRRSPSTVSPARWTGSRRGSTRSTGCAGSASPGPRRAAPRASVAPARCSSPVPTATARGGPRSTPAWCRPWRWTGRRW